MKQKHYTSIHGGELLDVGMHLPVVVEYEHNQANPSCGSSPREPEHVVITGLYMVAGFNNSISVSFLLNNMNKGKLEAALLAEIKDSQEYSDERSRTA